MVRDESTELSFFWTDTEIVHEAHYIQQIPSYRIRAGAEAGRRLTRRDAVLSDAAAPRVAWPTWLAGAALVFQAFFAMTHFGHRLGPEHGGTVALLVLIAAGGARWHSLAKHPLPWLVLAFIAYTVLEAAHASHLAPGLSFSKQLSTNSEPVRVGVLTCVIGAWMAGRLNRIPWLLGLMVAGFILAVLVCAPWSHFDAVVAGTLRLRLRSGYPENVVGEYAAMGLLLLSLYALARPPRGRAIVTVVLGLAGVLLLACLLYAQSRAAWLAAMLVPLTVVVQLRNVRGGGFRRPAIVTIVAAVAVAAALAVGYAIVARRFAGGEVIADALVHGNLAALPPSAVTLRAQLAALGLHAWLEHPLLGSGLRNIAPMIAASGIHNVDYVPPHLHDAYLQAVVGLGSIGAALLLAMFGLLVRDLWLARRAGAIGSALYGALLGSLGIVLVVNISDCLLWHLDYLRAPLEVLLGSCFAVSLTCRSGASTTGAATAGRA